VRLGERNEGWIGMAAFRNSKKIGQTIFLESGGLAGRECAGFDGVDGTAGDDGSGGVEEAGFGFGGGGRELGGGAREGEEVGGRILQAGRYFLVSFWEKRSDLFSQNGGVVTWQGCVQKFQKIGQTIFLENW